MNNLWTSENISKVGIVGLLLLILTTGATGYWVYGPSHREQVALLEKNNAALVAERDEWKKTSLDLLSAAKSISPVRMPIMGSAPSASQTISPADVREQMNLLKSLNNKDDEK